MVSPTDWPPIQVAPPLFGSMAAPRFHFQTSRANLTLSWAIQSMIYHQAKFRLAGFEKLIEELAIRTDVSPSYVGCSDCRPRHTVS